MGLVQCCWSFCEVRQGLVGGVASKPICISFCVYLSRRCYVTCDEMGTQKALRSAINRVFSAKGGVFWRGIRDSQLNEFWLKELEEWLAKPPHLQNRKKAAINIGRQPDGIYVLNRNVQVKTILIQSYKWLGVVQTCAIDKNRYLKIER